MGAHVSQAFEPWSPSLNAAISDRGMGEQWQQALGLLTVMQQADLVPCVISYSAAISACDEDGPFQSDSGLKKLCKANLTKF